MSVFVVDASVAVKWMLPEPLSTEAVRLQSPEHQLYTNGPWADYVIRLQGVF